MSLIPSFLLSLLILQILSIPTDCGDRKTRTAVATTILSSNKARRWSIFNDCTNRPVCQAICKCGHSLFFDLSKTAYAKGFQNECRKFKQQSITKLVNDHRVPFLMATKFFPRSKCSMFTCSGVYCPKWNDAKRRVITFLTRHPKMCKNMSTHKTVDRFGRQVKQWSDEFVKLFYDENSDLKEKLDREARNPFRQITSFFLRGFIPKYQFPCQINALFLYLEHVFTTPCPCGLTVPKEEIKKKEEMCKRPCAVIEEKNRLDAIVKSNIDKERLAYCTKNCVREVLAKWGVMTRKRMSWQQRYQQRIGCKQNHCPGWK